VIWGSSERLEGEVEGRFHGMVAVYGSGGGKIHREAARVLRSLMGTEKGGRGFFAVHEGYGGEIQAPVGGRRKEFKLFRVEARGGGEYRGD